MDTLKIYRQVINKQIKLKLEYKRLILTMLLLLIITHLAGCIYYLIVFKFL